MPKPGRPHSGRWVAYYRVSTDRQGDSGLGLDAQRKLVSDYLNGGSWGLSAEFTEVESGKRSDRPQLASALAMCRKLKAKLIVANLSRLSRNVSFISALMDSGVEFVAADMPHANKMALQVLAVFAEYERDQISERTRRALTQAKERGTKLGGPKRLEASTLGAAANRTNAERFAANTLPIIREIQSERCHDTARGCTGTQCTGRTERERRALVARRSEQHPQAGDEGCSSTRVRPAGRGNASLH